MHIFSTYRHPLTLTPYIKHMCVYTYTHTYNIKYIHIKLGHRSYLQGAHSPRWIYSTSTHEQTAQPGSSLLGEHRTRTQLLEDQKVSSAVKAGLCTGLLPLDGSGLSLSSLYP